MKIHIDYLEGKVEDFENINLKLTNEKKTFDKKIKAAEDKFNEAKRKLENEVERIKGETR